MPSDILKVDRAFINDLDGDRRRRAFTAAIFGLGETLGLRMVAEGVEREEQRSRLLALGCTLAQGFLFSPALPGDQIVEILIKDGVDIARRTVAKYREAMRIPSSVQRRREKTMRI